MIKLMQGFMAVLLVTAIAGTASAAGYTKQQCDKLEREYQTLQQKEKRGQLTPADRKRMGEIDSLTNVYCE